MEAIQELIPFALGGLIIPALLSALRAKKINPTATLLLTLVLAAIVGYAGSAIAGEQRVFADLPERMAALVIDTSLAFTGAQLAQQLVWKRLLPQRID